MQKFSKEAFKKSIIDNVKSQYRRTIDEATPQQVFQAVSYAIKDVIIDNWIATQKAYDEKNAKKVYYLSMEFLMGRALGNNIINLGAQEEIKEALEELGFDLNSIEDQEPDPALGNGGLEMCIRDRYKGYLFRVLSVENKILHKVMAVKQTISPEASEEAHEEK